MKTIVFNGWAAEESIWDACAFRRDRVFSYLEHLDGSSKRAVAAEPEPVVLVGFSMGGTFALETVLEHPEKIAALVLVSATARMMEERGPEEPDGRRGPLLWAGMSTHRREALRYGTELMNRGNPSPLFERANLDRGLDYLRDTDLRDRLEAIAGRTSFPVAILQGDRDGIVRPPNADFLRRIFPQAEFFPVPGAEHDLPRLAPSVVDAAVSRLSAAK